MPDKFRDTINLPIAIPVWGLVTLLGVGVFTAGVTFQKLDQVIESSKKIDLIQERQINALARLSGLELRVYELEKRQK
jgi:hypothetical protein